MDKSKYALYIYTYPQDKLVDEGGIIIKKKQLSDFRKINKNRQREISELG